jgi:hypothetical protein
MRGKSGLEHRYTWAKLSEDLTAEPHVLLHWAIGNDTVHCPNRMRLEGDPVYLDELGTARLS